MPIRLGLMLAALALILAPGCGGEDDSPDPSKAKQVTCTGGTCLGDPWASAGGFGDSCKTGDDCHSGLCGQDSVTGEMFCTQSCDAANVCPQGAGCFPTGTGSEQVCGPPAQ